MTGKAAKGFPSPFEVTTPPGCEGWERMYPHYYLFSKERREFEEGRLWFLDAVHNPDPMYPFDIIQPEGWWLTLPQYLSRVFMIPTSLGFEQRILNGYLYVSPTPVTDPKVIEERVEHFKRRAGYYFEHWDELYDKWVKKITELNREMESIEFKDLPEMEDESMITGATGIGSSYTLLQAYEKLNSLYYRAWQYHFEFHPIGYGAYLTFWDFCKRALPGISDDTIAKMVGGIDVVLFRPDDEVKRLAKLALELKVTDIIKRDGDPDRVIEGMKKSEVGRRWIQEFEKAKNPWFNMASGNGWYHYHRGWAENLSLPFGALKGYIEKLEKGEKIERPTARLREERERIASEYVALLKTEEDRKTFRQLLELSRKVFPFLEDHTFYEENWNWGILYRKIRELGHIFARHSFLKEPEDVFCLNRFEIHSALYELLIWWAGASKIVGQTYWAKEVERRKEIIRRLGEWAPPPALGVPPEEVNDPIMVMVWGITTERLNSWLTVDIKPEEITELKGFAASPGVVEGPARVLKSIDQIGQIQDGEILVCSCTTANWAPAFVKIRGAITDIGGVMTHAAIVCREYGIPAVVGTGFGTRSIKTGERVRLDGNTGIVTILR